MKGIENDLAHFREKWQNELRLSPKHSSQNTLQIQREGEQYEDNETKAKRLFVKGIEMERAGKLYEAIQFYRKAVQIVPDIEFKLDNVKSKLRENEINNFEFGMYIFYLQDILVKVEHLMFQMKKIMLV